MFWTTISRHKEKHISSWSARLVAKRDWREEATMDGSGPVVETLTQDGSQMDREMQHERRVCHQRTSTQLGRSCCQNGLQRNLCAKAFEMSRTSMVEMETAPIGKIWRKTNGLAGTHSASKSRGGRTWWRRTVIRNSV